jgi:hypothetical protein
MLDIDKGGNKGNAVTINRSNQPLQLIVIDKR